MKNPIRDVSIIGAGAMGASYAALLHDMDRRCVSLIAGGERGERLRREGLSVNGRHYTFSVIRPEEETPPADLLIVAVKNHHLEAAVREMKRRVGRKTIILSVMNGIDSEEKIGAAFGTEKVLYAVSVGIDAQRDGNRIRYTKQGKIFFGEAENSTVSERVRGVQALFDKAGIAYETPPDMIRIMWWKFMINVGINQASAVMRAPYRVFQTSGEARKLMDSAMREVIMLARAAGARLTDEDIDNWYKVLDGLGPEGKTSMLQDVEAGRKTEVEMFAGKMVELGRKYRVPAPVNEKLLHAIREIEAGYASNALKEYHKP
ncbi:MAG TPA: ketopantoate reductase family protein [Syntrophales bacterium]|nr:ketopantoate reductase family protein [Syntrophales bacterium]